MPGNQPAIKTGRGGLAVTTGKLSGRPAIGLDGSIGISGVLDGADNAGWRLVGAPHPSAGPEHVVPPCHLDAPVCQPSTLDGRGESDETSARLGSIVAWIGRKCLDFLKNPACARAGQHCKRTVVHSRRVSLPTMGSVRCKYVPPRKIFLLVH